MTHQLDSAEKELLLAIKEAPDDPLANLYMGDMALHLNQFSKALPYLKQAVASRPTDVESRLLLARCYLQLDDPQHARETLLPAANSDPADPRSHYMLATVYQKLNQPADRQRELDLFNKLSAAQKAKGLDETGAKAAEDPGKDPTPPPRSNP
jgi:predicted Zn-dependent protease